MNKGDYIALFIAGLTILSGVVIAYLGWEFTIHIAKHVGYSVARANILYFTFLLLTVGGIILGNK